MKFDIVGRIRNMRLPDGKTAILYSVYEAVSNSIHAINDRFGEENAASSGKIEVEIQNDEDGEIKVISVSDNGIGFTSENLQSFDTSDSRFKYQRGGKGVGRLIWIKMFDTIKVNSTYENGGQIERVQFTFDPEKDNSIQSLKRTSSRRGDVGTVIELSQLRSDQRGRIRPSSYLKDLALHFFPQFVAKTLPDIQIRFDGQKSSLNDYIKEHVEAPKKDVVTITIDGESHQLAIDHLYVKSSISTGLRNSYLLTAHGRLVGDPVSIERKYALKELADGKSYVAIVSSPFLDERVDQERLGFKLTAEQQEELEAQILKSAEKFLSEHIGEIRVRQKKTVQALVSEHPQLATQFANMDEYVENLSPGMDDEQIGQNLFVLLYREEKELRKRIDQFSSLESLEAEARARAEEMVAEISNQEKHRLAELVVKRHQLLQMANLLLKYEDDEKKVYHYEKVIHELICPLGEIFHSGEHTRHNLWMLDDTLAAYEFFASDKSIRSLAPESSSKKEPDLLFFNPLGFRRENTRDPVVIVEFKRPGDERPSQDPINQVLGYIDDLRDSKVRDVDGGVVSDIDENTPFECFIVCELTQSSRRQFERGIAQHHTPDGEGYYGWSSRHNARIRVVSFRKLLRDAELRNQAFFEQLKLSSPSLAAKQRSARVRQRRETENEAVRVQ